MVAKTFKHPGNACALIAIVVLGAVLVGCGDEEAEAPGRRGQLLDATLFPVVLDRDVLVIAQADGSHIEEGPVPVRSSPASNALSPDGRFKAFFRDGALFLQEGDGAPREVARAESAIWSFWSPDSSRFAYLLSSDQLESYAMYVVSTDGSQPVLLGESGLGGEGGDRPAWSPDASWIATYSPGYDAVRVLSATGAPAIEIREGSSGHFSWSPDSRFLAFDSAPSRTDPSLPPNTGGIVVADLTAPGDIRVIADGYWPRWSPAGDRIAFKRDRHAFTIRPDGSGLADLGLIGNEIYNDFTWPEDGQQVEFVRGGPNFPVYTIDLRTAVMTRRDAGYDVDWSGAVQISPDGGQIAFPGYEFGANGRSGWLLLDVVSGDVSQLSDGIGSGDGGDVFWSAGGARPAYPAGELGVFIAEGGGSPARRVSALDAREVAWSPDGQRLAIATGSGVAIVSVEGTEGASFDAGDGTPGGLTWSPDGKRLLYEVANAEEDSVGPVQIFAVEVDGAQVTPLTGASGFALGASWSPDGRTIAYDRIDGGATEVWLTDVNGANPQRLAGDGSGHLEWSPDGTMIAAVAGLHVDIIDVATGAVVRVAEVGGASAQAGYCPAVVVHWSRDTQVLDIVVTCHSPQI